MNKKIEIFEKLINCANREEARVLINENLKTLKNLVEFCKQHDIYSSGNKEVLIERIIAMTLGKRLAVEAIQNCELRR